MIASIAIALKELLALYSPGHVAVKFLKVNDSPVPDIKVELDKTAFVYVPNMQPWLLDEFTALGKVPETFLDHEALAKNWTVIRSKALNNEGLPMIPTGKMPVFGLPIVANYEGQSGISIGFMAEHDLGDGRRESIFMELDTDTEFPVFASVNTVRNRKELNRGVSNNHRYIPQIVDGIIGWNYLSLDGLVLKDSNSEGVIELFADCEFETETHKLISVGLVNPVGKSYYAYDQSVADGVKDKWVRENVLPVLTQVPSQTTVVELTAAKLSFYEWMAGVIATEQSSLSTEDATILIRVDYSTDVAYLAELFHRLTEGGIERFGKFRRVTFQIDYVDSYPSNLKAAVRHNAAWDAAAMWHHLGYYKKRALDRLTNSDQLREVLTTIYETGQKANAQEGIGN